MTGLHNLAREIERRQREARHKARTKIWQPTATPATSLGYRCERRIVYQRTRPEMAGQISEELASIFTEGNLHQLDVRRELMELGYEVVEAELNFRDTRLEITGTIDGKIALSGEHRSRRVPVEIKSTTGGAPRTADEMMMHRGLYGRYYCQGQSYLYLTSEPEMLYLFKDKITGLWTIVPAELRYDFTEGLLQKAERVRDHVRQGSMPARLADRSECVGCPWKDTTCHPEEDAPDPMLLAEDAELEDQLIERESLDDARKRYKTIDDTVKQRFKLTKGDRFVCGGFKIEKKKHGKGTRVDITRLPGKGAKGEDNVIQLPQ